MILKPSPEFWKVFKETSGALSCCEAVAIANIAGDAPEGVYIEFGVHHGKSAMAALQSMSRGLFYLVDPIFEDRELSQKILERIMTVNQFGSTLATVAKLSTEVIPEYDKYAYVMVDSGSHQDGLPMQEVKLLEDRLVAGGVICFHDYLSQFSEVKIAYDYLISTGKYSEITINWPEIIEYVKENDLENGNDSWHHTEMEFPCFVGALKRKGTDEILDDVINDFRHD